MPQLPSANALQRQRQVPCTRRRGIVSTIAAAIVLVLAGGVEHTAVAQTRTFWYALRSNTPLPIAGRVEEALLTAYVRRRFPDVQAQTVSVDELNRALAARNAKDRIFVVGDQRDLSRLGAVTAGRDVVSALGIELVNPRLTSAPMYILGRADTLADISKLRTGTVRVGYSALAHPLQPRDVQDVLRPLVGAAAIEAVALDSPALLARRLLADDASRIHLAAIYDNDPSVYLDRFLAIYNRERPRGDAGKLKAARPYVFPTAQAGFEPSRPRAAAGGTIDYVIIRYDDYKFYDYEELAPGQPNAGLLNVSPRGMPDISSDFPIVMTNIRRVDGNAESAELLRTLGDIYIAALFERPAYGSRCAGRASEIYRAYLLDAHVGDPTDRYKGLGFWGHLILMRTLAAQNAARYEAEARLLEERLRTDLKMPFSDQNEVLAFLAASVPKATVREQFSGDVSGLYARALQSIQAGVNAPAADKQAHFLEARRLLVASVAAGWSPSCARGGRAVWSTQNYDPFFHLALIESYLRLVVQ